MDIPKDKKSYAKLKKLFTSYFNTGSLKQERDDFYQDRLLRALEGVGLKQKAQHATINYLKRGGKADSLKVRLSKYESLDRIKNKYLTDGQNHALLLDMRKMVELLPQELRAMVLLSHLYGFTNPEIAELFNQDEYDVRESLRQAYSIMRGMNGT